MSTITYGSHTLDTAQFHPSSIDAMIRRGVAHFLGNEQASRVTSWLETEDGKAAVAGLDEAGQKVIKDTKKLEFQAEAIAALAAGTVGQGGNRGPRVDPLTAAMNVVARAEVITKLKAAGLKIPSGDKTVNLAGVEFTMGQLVERQITKNGESIKREAQKRVQEEERRAKKAKDAAASRDKSAAMDADALGL